MAAYASKTVLKLELEMIQLLLAKHNAVSPIFSKMKAVQLDSVISVTP